MKKFIIITTVFVTQCIIAQEKTPTKAKDSIKTEVVNVVTSYAPKVTDAFKIKRKPVIELTKEVEKKKLDYKIISVPVVSNFIPRSGTLKGIDVGKKERLFNNYVALGFGNNVTPFLEGFMHNVSRFDSEYGANLRFIGSFQNPVKNAQLNSNYYNIDAGVFYMQEEHYFNWKVGINAERDKYNWYGLPQNINYQEPTINTIKEEQTYSYYNVYGNLDFPDSYFKDAQASVAYFSDILGSNEFHGNITTLLALPLGRVGYDLEDIHLGISFNYIGGSFSHGYEQDDFSKKKHSFFNAGINPYYKFNTANFDIKIGGKVYFSMDLENSNNKFFFYPDASISYPIISKFANLYIGASGDLHQNSFKSFTDENPYISPTINILRTNEMYNFFSGLKGIVADNINYNVKVIYKQEENKPLYAIHKSKSNDGIKTASRDGFPFFGYEYGNSFDVLYDNVKTISAVGEIEYDLSKNLTLGLSGEFNKYSLKNQQKAWNLPTLKGELFGKYKKDKWYAAANIFYVGNRKGMLHDGSTSSPVNLKAYIDVNVNGGYHFNPLFSAFLKINNATNSSYQRFTNFNAQGIQVIGGVIWKFDNLF